MKRPASLKILSRKWEVEYATESKALDKDEIGCSDAEKQHITIKEGLKADQERSTVLHETIHAISDTLGLGLTERQVQGMETGLFAMNRDNARLFSYLRGKK